MTAGMRRVAVIFALLLTSGCATDRLYSAGVVQSASQRWTDPVPLCHRTPVAMPLLSIVVDAAFIPNDPVSSCLPSKNPISEERSDKIYLGGGRIDPSGRGSFPLSFYSVTIDNLDERTKSLGLRAEDIQPIMKHATRDTRQGRVLYWRYHDPIFSRQETINGLVWTHYAFSLYDSLSDDPSIPGISKVRRNELIAESVNNASAVAQITEVYTHEIDESHSVIAIGRFDREVIEDPGWYAQRVALLGRLVGAVKIRAIDPADIEFESHVARNGR
ncbi:hypothetical protein L2Y96_21215 [Luteibacter aegosomaticola]|uniref:hypothetical protein n=1 Tax=Luteibacter aegosomaticola TaxID=2911538 RepID=UPI001FF8F6ED|nr:hypothetical protein [Luteibacter aegosomaticola]UPG89878.1 hypothetical protein L2Y96_21215 [Luteibacter aegosomaticola]